MDSLLELIKKQRVYFDGAMGTMLLDAGLPAGTPPELWSLESPEAVEAVHRQFLDAGCNIVTANTFGVNSLKYDNYDRLISASVEIARNAVKKSSREKLFVALDIGPTGRLLEPLGDLGFEDAYEVFCRTVKSGVSAGADLILIETMNDSLEAKAALLAAKDCSRLPVFVCCAYSQDGKLMTGAEPEAMIAMLEGMGADAIGLNCSFGPDMALELIPRFLSCSSVPVIAMPNAGLPRADGDRTYYDVSPEQFSVYMKKISECGAGILGGCCGTTPMHIKAMIDAVRGDLFVPVQKKDITAVSSYTRAVTIGGSPVLIGERINPTGKSKLKKALRENNLSYILNEAVSQAEAGAHILDINAGLPDIDEVSMLKSIVTAVQSVCDLPLQLDSSDPKALDAAMRAYNGKPLVNSVNGKSSSMDSIFPLVKRYGGSVIALTMDEEGIPSSPEKRLEIADKIAKRARDFGIDKKDIIVDPLCMAASSDQESAENTLSAVRLIHEAGFKVSLGVSNISFGLPERDCINTVFFSKALDRGLDLAIMNPMSRPMMSVYYAHRALNGSDAGFLDYIGFAKGEEKKEPAKKDYGSLSLERAVIKGLSDDAVALSKEALLTMEPLDVINKRIIPALNEIGGQFERQEAFLPQLLMSAEAATKALSVVKERFPADESGKKGGVILATVKGDIHDIGKNIVKVMLESYGFKVYDLGRDVPCDRVLEAVKEHGCRLVGLSALMTTTVPAMEETIKLLKAYDPKITTVVGGAVLTKEYADMIGADFYAKDAMDTVRFAEEFYSLKE